MNILLTDIRKIEANSEPLPIPYSIANRIKEANSKHQPVFFTNLAFFCMVLRIADCLRLIFFDVWYKHQNPAYITPIATIVNMGFP